MTHIPLSNMPFKINLKYFRTDTFPVRNSVKARIRCVSVKLAINVAGNIAVNVMDCRFKIGKMTGNA